MRDCNFLEEKMYQLWDDHFADVPRKNLVLISFGKYSKRQLGCIKQADSRSKIKTLLKKKSDEHSIQDVPSISLITVTRYFQDLYIPDFVVDTTIAHEMVHYSHGFHSPLPKKFKHPHKGNIVNKDLIARGLGVELEAAERWLKENWWRYLMGRSKM